MLYNVIYRMCYRKQVTFNNASDNQTNGLYGGTTNPNHSPFVTGYMGGPLTPTTVRSSDS